MRISDWSSDVCSSDLILRPCLRRMPLFWMPAAAPCDISTSSSPSHDAPYSLPWHGCWPRHGLKTQHATRSLLKHSVPNTPMSLIEPGLGLRSEEHTSELQSLLRISYAVFCLNQNTTAIT